MIQKLKWDDNYVTGNYKLDSYHKRIFDVLNELLDMLEDTKTYKNKIPAKSEEFLKTVFNHLDIETNLLEKYEIPDRQDHIKAHNKLKKELQSIKKYRLTVLLDSIAISDIVYSYFLEHFQNYDKIHLPILNKKIAEENSK